MRASRIRPRLVAALAASAVALGAGACGRPLDEGVWRLQQAGAPDPLIDSCSLLAPGVGFGEARLRISGVAVRWAIQSPGLAAPVTMFGRLKHPASGEPDEFTLDGSVDDETIVLAGAVCSVEFGQIEIEAAVESPSSFTGTMTVHYEVRPAGAASCPQTCDVRTGVRGDRQGPD
jgi:hypothetical protein